ncbi:MAG: DUF1501 domain-containing protein [Bacteroidota bacterium]|nr:DUF1501 domain-containing protein [Bacteroidota bacterium]
MKSIQDIDRREFLFKSTLSLGALALGTLLPGGDLFAGTPGTGIKGILGAPHFAPKAKRIIYLFQNGGPSQIELFDYKPKLEKMFGQDLPESVRQGQRLTGMTANQKSLPLVPSYYKFAQYGKSGAWVSELMPYTSRIVDELCFVKSMHTEAINHDPAITFFQSGSQIAGRPSFGSWISYGLGSENKDLPAFSVLLSKGKKGQAQPLYARLWGSGFLPSLHQGVQFRSGKDPVVYLNDPEGLSRDERRKMLDYLSDLNHLHMQQVSDPEIESRIAQYEMAYKMQTSVPEAMSLKDEPNETFELYGEDSRTPGTFAANCILARKLAEKGVKFIQLYHQGWDQHGALMGAIEGQCKDVDQAGAALVVDLKRRGLLDETLVVWGGEFGRTNYCQGNLAKDKFGRDHHPRCFTMWMAGGGVKPGMSYGETDDFSYNILRDPVHVHDFQATAMHLMGIDHEKLTFKHQGRRYRLTDVHGKVVKSILV